MWNSPELLVHYAKKHATTAARLGGSVLAGSLIAAPIALEQAAEKTRVETSLIGVPLETTLRPSDELRLEITNTKTIYVPLKNEKVAINARINGLPEIWGVHDISNLVSPKSLEVVTSLSSSRQGALRGYEEKLRDECIDTFLHYETFGGVALGLGIFGLGAYRRKKSEKTDEITPNFLKKASVAVGAGVLALGTTSVGAYLQYEKWVSTQPSAKAVYPIYGLVGTQFEGTYTDDPQLAGTLNLGIPYLQHILQRRNESTEQFLEQSVESLHAHKNYLPKLAEGQRAILAVSNLHASRPMITFLREFVAEFEQINGKGSLVLVDAGDQGTGTVFDHEAITAYGDINPNGEGGYVDGNHTLKPNQDSLAHTDLVKLDGFTKLDDLKLYGADDVQITPFLGRPFYPNPELTEEVLGQNVAKEVQNESVDVIVLHQPKAVASLLGFSSPEALYTDSADPEIDTNVLDKTKLILSGHTHDRAARIIHNDDGTWTYVLTLGAAGGANEAPTINDWSDPGAPPVREAGFSIVLQDTDSRLITDEYAYSVTQDGLFTVVDHTEINPESPRKTSARGKTTN